MNMDEKPSYYDQNYQIKRKDWCANFGRGLCSAVLKILYDIEYKNIDRLKQLEDKGFVMLPKHQSWLDIPLEGMLLKEALDRCGNYIMKNSLPKWIFEPLGGISIIREKDMKNLVKHYMKEYALSSPEMNDAEIKRKAFKEAVKEANARKERVYNYEIPNLLARNEIIVAHPEGTRYFKQLVKLEPGNINKLLKVQKQMGQQITFVPLEINYEKSRIILNVKNPIQVKDNDLETLMKHLTHEVELWL
jgi:hypothetical protein